MKDVKKISISISLYATTLQIQFQFAKTNENINTGNTVMNIFINGFFRQKKPYQRYKLEQYH